MTKKYTIPTIEKLLDAGVHFGHQVKRWHPAMEEFIYTARNDIHIVDLEQTERLVEEAADFLYGVAKKGGKIIFIGTKKQARDVVEIEGKRSGAMYVTERWLGGTITNFDVIKKNNIDKLLDLKNRKEKGDLKMYTKKERLLIDREIEKLEKFVGGLTPMKKTPDTVVIIDSKRERTAVKEAIRAKIPVVAMLDTNCNPSGIDYVIPGNDDAIRSIAIVVKALADAIEAGYKDFADGFAEAQAAAEKVEAAKVEEKPETIKKEEKVEEKQVAKKIEKSPKQEKKTVKVAEKSEPAKKRGRPKKETKSKKK